MEGSDLTLQDLFSLNELNDKEELINRALRMVYPHGIHIVRLARSP